MDKRISDIFDYGDEIVVDWEIGEGCDPAEIKELTMKRIHEGESFPTEMKRAIKKTRPAWRTALVAAVVALLLIGSAVAIYQYTLKDAAIEDVPTDASQRYEWRAGETETQLSLNGFTDSPEYQAYVEWEDWNRAWNAEHPDPWGELGVDDSYTETPRNYSTYRAYFAEQGEALDAIAEEYGLTLLSEHHFIRSETQLCRALGLESIVAEGYSVEDGYFFDNGAFKASGDITVNGKSAMYTIWNNVRGSFIPLSGVIPEEHTEWSYTTKDGFEVILMTDELRGQTTIIAPLTGCFVTATFNTDDAQAAEALADAIDLRALDALFATESTRAAAEKSIAYYVENLSSETVVIDIGDDEQAVLEYLGDWYPTVLPEGCELYNMSVESSDHFGDYYRVSRSYDGGNVFASFSYRELDPLNGENEETRGQLATYTEYYNSYLAINTDCVITPCTVSGYEALLSEPNGSGYGDYELTWVDTDRQLLFRLSMSGATREALMAAAESIDGTAPEMPPVRNASTAEERFQSSVMPLGEVMFYYDSYISQDVETKRVFAELGYYGVTGLPDGMTDVFTYAQRMHMFEYYWPGRADWQEVWRNYGAAELNHDIALEYRRFDDGRTAEAYEIEKQYDREFFGLTDCTVGSCEGYMCFDSGRIVQWYDEDNDLIFRLTVSSLVNDVTETELLALAESVTLEPWTEPEQCTNPVPYDTTTPAQVYAELGRYELPGTALGGASLAENRTTDDRQLTPLWFSADGPWVSELVIATYADGLALGWHRTWADEARTEENGAASFATITRYLLACDDSGSVQTGLSVNGYDAVCVYYPSEYSDELRTQLIWYDSDKGLIFILFDFPGEEGEARTAAQLMTIAESVIIQ